MNWRILTVRQPGNAVPETDSEISVQRTVKRAYDNHAGQTGIEIFRPAQSRDRESKWDECPADPNLIPNWVKREMEDKKANTLQLQYG